MATIPLQKAWIARTVSGNSFQIIEFPESASLTAKAGEFVYLASGYVTEIGNSPALILGMLAEDGHNSTQGAYNVGVYIANADTIFCANKVSDAAGSGTGGTGAATAVGDVGSDLSLYRDTTLNITHVTRSVSSPAYRAICVDFDHRDTVTDTGGRLLFMIKGWFRQLFSTS